MRYTNKAMEQVGRKIITRYAFRNGSIKVYNKKIGPNYPRSKANGRNIDLFNEIGDIRDEILQVKSMVRELVNIWK